MFKLPNLSYRYNALEPYIDEQTMHIHHDKHHAGYVNKLNTALEGHDEFLKMDINDILKELNSIPEKIRTAVRNTGGGHANHSLFWTILGTDKNQLPQDALLKEVKSTFRNFSTFKEQFTKSATNLFGSGWTWLVVDDGKLSIENTQNQTSPLSEGKTPLLCIDVWEHAYYLKYQNRRAEYIEAWWNVVNWDEVQRRLKRAIE